MLLVKPSYEIMTPLDGPEIMRTIELAGRTCYKSEEKITDTSAEKFCQQIMTRGHLSVIEHVSVSVRFIANRGFTHELVRHRLAAYSQESTRYCSYGGGVTFIIPPQVTTIEPGEYLGACCDQTWPETDKLWWHAMADCDTAYSLLLKSKWSPQQARGVLPIDLKTEIVMTANLREWRHVFSLRCSKAAHPQMRELMIPLAKEFQDAMPVLFNDCEIVE